MQFLLPGFFRSKCSYYCVNRMTWKSENCIYLQCEGDLSDKVSVYNFSHCEVMLIHNVEVYINVSACQSFICWSNNIYKSVYNELSIRCVYISVLICLRPVTGAPPLTNDFTHEQMTLNEFWIVNYSSVWIRAGESDSVVLFADWRQIFRRLSAHSC